MTTNVSLASAIWEQIAWVLLTKKAGRTIGFVTAKQFREIEGDDAEIIPAASVEPKMQE